MTLSGLRGRSLGVSSLRGKSTIADCGCEGSPKKEKKMNKCRFRAKNTLWLGWLAVALVVVAAFPLTAPAAVRAVLGEYCTWDG